MFIFILSGFSSVQLHSHIRLFATPWTAARQASLSITNSRSPPKSMSIKSVMLSSHLILCRPLLLLRAIPPSIRVFSNESTLCMRWPKYWSFGFSIRPSNEHPRLISFRFNKVYQVLAFQVATLFNIKSIVKYPQFQFHFSNEYVSRKMIHRQPGGSCCMEQGAQLGAL